MASIQAWNLDCACFRLAKPFVRCFSSYEVEGLSWSGEKNGRKRGKCRPLLVAFGLGLAALSLALRVTLEIDLLG